ncbi:hypothetical protein Hbut_0124 [Hyperthermus butylicus DSM 5456]|uniref:DUF488 domain-containing protein n=1 Tax=Hyperthermus butylicus (strain DSM 5456 / JCM 9403 / PLM1-5) TaxID=415426 RepID=A2BJ38_HYPBU|nr:hypothetical protein Hbut_0124 [Hyperthermus butylicus DSM 5456]
MLKLYRVKVVVDVRRFPTSRRVPWFRREVLMELLPVHGIGYIWLGEVLGGFRPRGYEEYMKSEGYRRGIEMLVKVVESARGPVAVMCRERLWFRCHRRFIADTLTSMGYKVMHIIDANRATPHYRRRRE